MRLLRNFLGMAVDELFVNQFMSPNSRCVAEGALAGRSDHPALYQQEKGDAGIIQLLLLVIESANGVR